MTKLARLVTSALAVSLASVSASASETTRWSVELAGLRSSTGTDARLRPPLSTTEGALKVSPTWATSLGLRYQVTSRLEITGGAIDLRHRLEGIDLSGSVAPRSSHLTGAFLGAQGRFEIFPGLELVSGPRLLFVSDDSVRFVDENGDARNLDLEADGTPWAFGIGLEFPACNCRKSWAGALGFDYLDLRLRVGGGGARSASPHWLGVRFGITYRP